MGIGTIVECDAEKDAAWHNKGKDLDEATRLHLAPVSAGAACGTALCVRRGAVKMAKILVVDDVSENRYLLDVLLSGHGYEVVTAQNGAEALELALSEGTVLVISDILMPVMDGFELCRQWKANDRLTGIPFVFYTATYTDAKDEKFALSLGAERFVIKPQKPEELIRIVREALEEARQTEPTVRTMPLGEEMEVLRHYNEALFRKLEKKVTQLESEIAERTKAESTLREQEALLRGILDNLQDAFLRADLSGRLAMVSRSAARMYGYESIQEMEGLAAERLYADPQERAVIVREIQRSGRVSDRIGQARRKDGSTFWVSMNAQICRDETGKMVGTEGFVRDITERRRGDAEREQLARAIEQAAEIILVTDGQGTIQYVNPAFEIVTGYSREEAIGKTPRIVKSGEQDEAFYRSLWETIGGGRIWQGRFVNRKKDGTTYTEEATISPVRDAGGVIAAFVAVKRDITRDLSLKAQLLQSQRMEGIGRLAGGVAHDFNNLLSVILNCTEFALQGVREGDPMKSDLQEVLKAGERAAALTRQLLAFSRKQVLEPQVLNLNRIVDNLERMLRRVIGEDVNLKLALQPALGRVRADPGQIEQVLMNLVINARDAMPAGGRLTIETAEVELDEEYTAHHMSVAPGPYVLLAISDTGCGMDDQTKSRLFEPFFTTKEKGKGTGLGLSTVYGIVKQSGGDIWAYSELGRGTTFKVYFPLATEEGDPVPASRMPQRPAIGTETILVVEDEPAVREVAVRILRAAGYRVLTAANGNDALLTSQTYSGVIDLLLTDVVMPKTGGRQIAERMCVQRPDMRVLYMSGYTDDAIVHQGVLDPGTRFIGKPFSAADLTRKIRDALDDAVPGDGAVGNGDEPPTTIPQNPRVVALGEVPREIVDKLRTAVVAARYDEMLRLLEEVQRSVPSVADSLRRLVNAFDYDGLGDVLGRVRESGVRS
jgi:two-component system, cell cycle sensor histidine kinase and response regulator CckA